MITIKNITKQYDKKTIIEDISFEVAKGELVVLIGPSGCGKTTLLKIINRLVRPTSGNVYIDGQSIFEQNVIALRRNIGYVIQQTGLFPHMTVRENIEIIPRLQKKSKTDIYRRSLELMEMVGLNPSEYLDRYPFQLSGGQQQRIGVARAFACDPEVILMDEPFSAVDPLARLQLQDELAELQMKVRKTILFVTHDINEAIKIADRICIINEKNIVQYGSTEEIMKNPANDFVAEFIGKNRIWSSPEYIHAENIMMTNPVCVSAETSLKRCMERMRMYNLDNLFVVDRNKMLLGGVEARAIQVQYDKTIPVSEIMYTDIGAALPNANVVEVLQLINNSEINCIPVINENGILQGVITQSSLLVTLSQQYLDFQQKRGEVNESVHVYGE